MHSLLPTPLSLCRRKRAPWSLHAAWRCAEAYWSQLATHDVHEALLLQLQLLLTYEAAWQLDHSITSIIQLVQHMMQRALLVDSLCIHSVPYTVYSSVE